MHEKFVEPSKKYADIIIDEDNKGIEETLELLKEKFC